MEPKNLRCLVINDIVDINKYGLTNNNVLILLFKSESFKKCEEYRFNQDFNIHYYRADNIDETIIVGVNRYTNCNTIEYDEKKHIIRIRYTKMEFYNMSQLKLLRKDKIGNMLLEFGDSEYDSDK